MVEMMVKVVEMMVENIVPLIFLLLTSYFSLSFNFSPYSLLFFFFCFFIHKNDIKIWRSFRIFGESMEQM